MSFLLLSKSFARTALCIRTTCKRSACLRLYRLTMGVRSVLRSSCGVLKTTFFNTEKKSKISKKEPEEKKKKKTKKTTKKKKKTQKMDDLRARKPYTSTSPRRRSWLGRTSCLGRTRSALLRRSPKPPRTTAIPKLGRPH